MRVGILMRQESHRWRQDFRTLVLPSLHVRTVTGIQDWAAYIISIKIIINSKAEFFQPPRLLYTPGRSLTGPWQQPGRRSFAFHCSLLIAKSCGREIKGHKNALKVIIIAFSLVFCPNFLRFWELRASAPPLGNSSSCSIAGETIKRNSNVIIYDGIIKSNKQPVLSGVELLKLLPFESIRSCCHLGGAAEWVVGWFWWCSFESFWAMLHWLLGSPAAV